MIRGVISIAAAMIAAGQAAFGAPVRETMVLRRLPDPCEPFAPALKRAKKGVSKLSAGRSQAKRRLDMRRMHPHGWKKGRKP